MQTELLCPDLVEHAPYTGMDTLTHILVVTITFISVVVLIPASMNIIVMVLLTYIFWYTYTVMMIDDKSCIVHCSAEALRQDRLTSCQQHIRHTPVHWSSGQVQPHGAPPGQAGQQGGALC